MYPFSAGRCETFGISHEERAAVVVSYRRSYFARLLMNKLSTEYRVLG